MAAVNGIPLGTLGSGASRSAIAFVLRGPASESRLLSVSGGWETELRAGAACIVARTASEQCDEKLLEGAINAVNEALDIAAVLDSDVLLAKHPGDEFIIWRRRTTVTLTVQHLFDFRMSVGHVGLVITRADGTTEIPVERIPEWMPAFRFFRLSQASNDLFEAYRNLFLALEAVLDQLFPKRPNEGEKQWLVRAFHEVARTINLTQFQPQPTPDPAESLVDWFYGVRLNLFHAKHGRTYIPEVRVSYSAVSAAYAPLVRLWRSIVETFQDARARGGAVTNIGFQMMAKSGFKDTHAAVSSDTTPVSPEQTVFNPSGAQMIAFHEAVTIADDAPDRIRISAREPKLAKRLASVARTGIVTKKGEPMVASDDFGNIETEGIDEFELRFIARLINTKQPRTEF